MASSQSKVDLDFVLQIARDAGDLINQHFGLGRRVIPRSSHKSQDLQSQTESKINFKSDADLVTEIDVAVEKLLTDAILARFGNQGHVILGEESAPVDNPTYDSKKGGSGSAEFEKLLTEKPTWIIDPIDGTTNFVHGVPFVAVSIGFYENFQGIIGVVYNPILDEMFYAESGKGAYLQSRMIERLETTTGSTVTESEIKKSEAETVNSSFKKMKLSRTSSEACKSITLGDSLIGCGFLVSEIAKLRNNKSSLETDICLKLEKGLESQSESNQKNSLSISEDVNDPKTRWLQNLRNCIFANIARVLPHCRDFRRCGSAALDMCNVACGRLDGYFEFGPHEWDIAAGIIICKEAGCWIGDFDGKSRIARELHGRRIMVCCNEGLALELGEKLDCYGV